MNTWYEVSIILQSEQKKIHITDTQSLEVAENKRNELALAGLKVVIDEYIIKEDKPVLVGEIK